MPDVVISNEGPVRRIRMNRPDKKNALTLAMYEAMAAAIEEAGSADPTAVRDAIAASDYQPLTVSTGPVEFDETGQNTNAGIAVMQVQDAAIKQVFPNELAEADYRFPAAPAGS